MVEAVFTLLLLKAFFVLFVDVGIVVSFGTVAFGLASTGVCDGGPTGGCSGAATRGATGATTGGCTRGATGERTGGATVSV